jgi:hypothetical protein
MKAKGKINRDTERVESNSERERNKLDKNNLKSELNNRLENDRFSDAFKI